MSSDSITNFIEPIDTVISWAVRTLEADPYWDRVERIDNYSWSEVYKVLAALQTPSCVVVYKGGSYQNQPRTKRMFSVFIAERQWVDKNEAEVCISATVTKVFGLLDHELAQTDASPPVDTTALIRARRDTYIPFKWSGVTAYELSFEIEDY